MKFTVDEQTSLLDAVAQKYPATSKSSIRKWIAQERLLVNDVIQNKNIEIDANSQIEITQKKTASWKYPYLLSR